MEMKKREDAVEDRRDFLKRSAVTAAAAGAVAAVVAWKQFFLSLPMINSCTLFLLHLFSLLLLLVVVVAVGGVLEGIDMSLLSGCDAVRML